MGWVFVGGSLEKEGLYIYIYMTDLCCCMSEINTTLYSNCSPIKNCKKKKAQFTKESREMLTKQTEVK